jgi:hypothetical protein
MNQTKKRLKIIKLAISITDIETIQLQIFKLSPLKTDLKIQEIIAGLQAENYAQTQALITTYIETPMEEILQRTAQEARQIKKAEEKDIIEEFDLFVTSPVKQGGVEKEEFDFRTLEPENTPKREQEVIDFDTLLNIAADDILPGNIELDIKETPQDTFFNEEDYHTKRIKESHIDTETIPKDTFFDTEETQKEEIPIDQIEEESIMSTEESHIDTVTIPQDTFFTTEEAPVVQEVQKEKVNISQIEDEKTVLPEESNRKIASQYGAIPYIDQKFKNMHTQYPPIQESDENFSSVNAWLLQISNDGYSDGQMEEIIKHIAKLTEANKLAEAAQLLLISGATKSKFAQFILARALYKGEILQKNLPESFTLINRLAMDDDYPEAICDLAQFYEHGIGIGKDKKRAEMLFKDAMDLDIQRAIGHYERLRKQNSGLFSAFKK